MGQDMERVSHAIVLRPEESSFLHFPFGPRLLPLHSKGGLGPATPSGPAAAASEFIGGKQRPREVTAQSQPVSSFCFQSNPFYFVIGIRLRPRVIK